MESQLDNLNDKELSVIEATAKGVSQSLCKPSN
ncbi:hypothetical protein [Sellimonas intestinalis]